MSVFSRQFKPLAVRRRARPDIGPGAFDEIALTNDRRIMGRSSSRGRAGWGKVSEISVRHDPFEAFEKHAERWGYREVIS